MKTTWVLLGVIAAVAVVAWYVWTSDDQAPISAEGEAEVEELTLVALTDAPVLPTLELS
ncbi:MAG: hypothetical protein IIA54_00480 [Chloroflexi bacterium]|nr:hypothetical protein [Chloroflexota bacterium]